ncbi:hypothetical protein [Pleionea mediterranea]|uniref:Uncharacterized protein n=1 Tax=Pleionea mediterranea TaxID=523701 RepID=A0A316FYI4_9GAMM|nr:hypothetical protein [Pleionea mediterranea]PWK53721.1 hypothetical protein C8D97_102109 [Pleionea mediterranea]
MKKYFLILALGFSQTDILASNIEVGLGLSGGTSTNISQLNNGTEGNLYESLFRFELEENNYRNFELDIDSSISRFYYTPENLSSETQYELALTSRYFFTDINSSVGVFSDISQVPINRFQAQEVNNQREASTSAIFGNHFIRLSGKTQFGFDYQHAKFSVDSDVPTFRLQDASREEQQALFSLSNKLNSNNTLQLRFQKKDTDFKDENNLENSDYFQYDIIASWQGETETTTINLEIGNSRVKDLLGRQYEDENGQLILNRQINTQQRLRLQLNKGVASLFTLDRTTGEIFVNQQNDSISQAQTAEGGGMQYDITMGRFGITTSYFESQLKGVFIPSQEVTRNKGLLIQMALGSSSIQNAQTRISSFFTQDELDAEPGISVVNENYVKQHVFTVSHQFSPAFNTSLQYVKRDAFQYFFNGNRTNINSEAIILSFEYVHNTIF